ESIFFPFTNNLKNSKYKNGLRLQSQKICDSFDLFATQLDCQKWSFYELAEELNSSPADTRQVVKEEFINRINFNNYPPVEVLNGLDDFDILRRTYRFERFKF